MAVLGQEVILEAGQPLTRATPTGPFAGQLQPPQGSLVQNNAAW
eukprot:CAMPEP_0119537404 /NCGR_PEP_ID=MMETSP1344-20130328/50091_1 /TAXON_ID=236787 /ORGANISM="Florenciella parvula, Strain CCMP2471" /LENGTH=43 /DNA_ID= /DNA_START= /DNA_END= /DNA_ORIENTATION=